MDTEFNFEQEDFYLCMNCHKIYNENPWQCQGSDGKIHSKFVDMAKFLGGHPKVKSFTLHKSILRFSIGQIDNLDFITSLGNKNLQGILNEHGFKTIAEVSTRTQNEGPNNKSIEEVEKEALDLALDLNKQGEKYFVFSNSFLGNYVSYTFMKRG